ncbi:MAG: hypothetical protein M0R41_18205 [Methylobacter tundripaludum]|nr:hypothetical protein [Methylobacter tundripaludum]
MPGQAPTISSIAITSATGIQNNTLNAEDTVSITVAMSEATTVTGSPRLALNIGGNLVQASYVSGSGGTELVFSYTVQAGQTDANGVSVVADSLSFNGGSLSDAIVNQGGSTPGSASRIESIERIDLSGSGDNTLTLGLKDVLDMAGFNNFNNANGWADGTYDLAAGGANFINPEQRHQVVIDGNAGDAVNSSGWGASVGTVTNNGHTYDVYNQGSYAQLLIDASITQTVI